MTRGYKSYLDLILLLTLAVGLRFFSFFQSVIDHDESTYIVIARDLFDGSDLYTDITDTKPIGIFIIFGLILKLAGNSIFWFRFIVSLLIGITGYWLYCFQLNRIKSRKAALASGILYVFFVSTWRSYGISCNTELFFTFFNALALFLLFQSGKWYYIALSGFLFGISFIIKYSAVFDFAAIMLFYYVNRVCQKETWRSIFIDVLITLIFFLIPFGLVHLYFWLNGNFDDFLFATYKVAGNYRSDVSYTKLFRGFIDVMVLLLPIWIFFYTMLIKRNQIVDRGYKILILVWFVFVCLSIIQLGNNFAHYYLQFALPVSLLGGVFFHEKINTIPVVKYFTSGWTSKVILGVLIFIIIFSAKKEYFDKPDYPKAIANYLNRKLSPGDQIYTGNSYQIIYFLTNKKSPTPYVHSTMLFQPRLLKIMGIDQQEEFSKIFKQYPGYVLKKIDERPRWDLSVFDAFLTKYHYKLDTIFEGRSVVKVYTHE